MSTTMGKPLQFYFRFRNRLYFMAKHARLIHWLTFVPYYVAEAGGRIAAYTLVGRRREQSPLDELTEREREVLALIAEGHSNAGICKRLFLSPKTVETHVRHILLKLGIGERDDYHRRVLAVLAYLRG